MKKQLLLFCFALFFGQSYAQNWQTVGSGLPSHFANANNEILEFNGEMYSVGYVFDGIDTYTPKVFKLTGGVWSEVGSGFTSSLSATYNIYAIAEYNSELYIAGIFVLDNGVDAPFNNVAKWDDVNSRWVAVGDGTGTGVVNELTVFNAKLYAGGDFDDLGVAGTNNIAVWDGTSWGAVGTGMSTTTYASEDPDQISSMVVYNSKLYVGGKFDDAGGELVHNIAHWDGTNWAYLKGTAVEGGGGVGDGFSGNVAIMSLQVFETDLYIGGMFTTYYNSTYSGSSTAIPNHLVVWNGTNFAAPTQATPANIRINAMTVFDGRIYIGNINDSNIYSWDASIFDWRLEPDRDPIRQRVTNFYSNATDIYYAQSYGVYQLVDPLASFYVSDNAPCEGESVTFTDASTGSNTITAWNWTFPGGTPASSTEQNPVIVYNTKGNYDVTLEVTSADGTNSTTIVDRITMNDDITITQHPGDVTICSNEQASFSTAASYTGGSVAYQWQILPVGGAWIDLANDGSVSGATSATLNYTVSADMSNFIFRCQISKCSNIVTTNEATLTVTESPLIAEQPVTQAICVSGDAAFTVAATHSSATITYQWQYLLFPNTYTNLSDAGVYTGTNTATLSVTGVNNTLAELYESDNSDGKTSAIFRCVLSANGCAVNTALAYLNIHDAPTVTSDPTDVTMCDTGAGVNTIFSVTSSLTTGGFSYQWQVDDGTGFVDVIDDAVYSGATTKDLSLTGATSTLSGYQYRCEIGACAAPVYSLAATLTIDGQPVLVQGPVQADICEGSDATFTVEATGNALTYQWQEYTGSGSYVDISDDLTYSGTGSSTLQISAATTNMDAYRYKCVIMSGSCTLNTGNVALRVYTQPTLTMATNNTTTVCDGGSTTFRVNPSTTLNTTVFSYQWQVDLIGIGTFTDVTDGTEYAGTTTSILTFSAATLSMDGLQYRCVIKGCITENASGVETLTVNQLPLIIESPQSQTVCHGASVTFTALATGSDLTYTWWRDTGDGNYTQETSPNANPDYTFNADNSFNGYKYKCIATAGNCGQTDESFEATLTVQETRILTVSEQNVSICAGETATFSVEMSNVDGLTFQWSDGNGDLADDAIYSGVTTSTLTVVGATNPQNSFTCSITGQCGSASTGFQLLVFGTEKPLITPQFGVPSNPQLVATGNWTLTSPSFEWFLNDVFYQNSGSDPTITIDQAGSYTVVATSNNCEHPVSDAVVIVITGFENGLSTSEVNFYPNPVSNKLTLEMGDDFNLDNGVNIILTNVNGKEVFNTNYNSLYSRKTEIDMTAYESGIYLVRVINGDKMVQYKVRKQ